MQQGSCGMKSIPLGWMQCSHLLLCTNGLVLVVCFVSWGGKGKTGRLVWMCMFWRIDAVGVDAFTVVDEGEVDRVCQLCKPGVMAG